MLKKIQTASSDWTDKTLSMLRSENLEACEKRLEGLFLPSLFSSTATDEDAEKIYAESLFSLSSDKRDSRLHTIGSIRKAVIDNFPVTLATLSEQEHDLLVRMILNGGKCRISDWNDLIPAEYLIRRLICSVSKTGDTFIIQMPHQLVTGAVLLLASDEHDRMRTIIDDFNDRIEMTLYLNGFLYADFPEKDLQTRLAEACHRQLEAHDIRAFILSSYVCCYDASGRLMIIHPANAQPLYLAEKCIPYTDKKLIDQNELTAICSSIDAVEIPIMDHMTGAIETFLRPELQAKDAADDLLFLAKQDVDESEMVRVLTSMITSPLSENMLSALHELHTKTPRWLSYSMKLES